MSNIKKSGSGKKWVGIVFLFVGIVLLSKKLGLFVPHWVTSWPMLLIVIGCITGSKQRFKNPNSFILIIIGAIFLLDKIFKNIDFHDFAWPVIIIGIGFYLIIGRRDRHGFKNRSFDQHNWDKRVFDEPNVTATSEEDPAFTETDHHTSFTTAESSQEDYLDTVSIFGGIKKNIVSKNFRGGEITTIMGGAEINFIQSDIQGKVILEVTQLFGGTKIIVPQQWKVSSEMVALFGGIEDRRPVMPETIPENGKLLIIKGTSIFGGIDIRSY